MAAEASAGTATPASTLAAGMSAEEETPDQRGAKRETPDEGDTVEEKQSRKKSKGDRKTEYKKRTMERLCLKREGTDSRA